MVNDDIVVGHIPVRFWKIMSMFLKLTGSHMEVKVTAKHVNRGAGYGLEISCKYHICGREKAVTWVSNKVNLIIKEHECVVNRCLDEKKNSKNSKIMNFWFSGQNISLSTLYR